jgi:hypothetical protein
MSLCLVNRFTSSKIQTQRVNQSFTDTNELSRILPAYKRIRVCSGVVRFGSLRLWVDP